MIKNDLKSINTHGFKCKIVDECIEIDLPHAIIYVNRRPHYCDRGRFGFWVEVKRGFEIKLDIDDADFFPRYFFKLQRAFDEMKDWIDFNNEKLGLKTEKETT